MTNKHWFLLIVVLITGVLMYIKSQSDQQNRELVKTLKQLYDQSEGQLKRIAELKMDSGSDPSSISAVEMRATLSELETSFIIWQENTATLLKQTDRHIKKEDRTKLVELKEKGDDLNKQYMVVLDQVAAMVTIEEAQELSEE